MLRTIFFVLLCFVASASYVAAFECSKLAVQVDSPENNYRPPLEAKVIGREKLYLYSAPNVRCRMKGVFVVKGDVLTVYKSYDGWANVMYISPNGVDSMGWVLENRLKKIGQYGHNP